MNNFKFKAVFGPLPSSMIPKLAPVSLPADAPKKGNGMLLFAVFASAVLIGGYAIYKKNKREKERRQT